MKRLFSLLMVLTLAAALCLSVWADDSNPDSGINNGGNTSTVTTDNQGVYVTGYTVTTPAGGEITTIDRDSRFNLILRVADYGAYNNFIPADQIQRCFLINRCRIKNTQKSSADHLINLGRQWV